MRIPRAQDTGALHSRTIEKRIAAENKASIRRFVLITFIIARLKPEVMVRRTEKRLQKPMMLYPQST
jgi:hypothetical protein